MTGKGMAARISAAARGMLRRLVGPELTASEKVGGLLEVVKAGRSSADARRAIRRRVNRQAEELRRELRERKRRGRPARGTVGAKSPGALTGCSACAKWRAGGLAADRLRWRGKGEA